MKYKKYAAFTVAVCTALNSGFYCSSEKNTVYAAENYLNAAVSSQGIYDSPSYIRGDKASVIYDSELKSNVLDLHGDSFGSGWLQLPEMFIADCENGFTFSLNFRLDSQAEDYARLFQFSSTPFGTGSVPWYSSPDISFDLNDKSSYRSSVFAGRTSATEKRSMFTLSAAPDSEKWHRLAVVYTPDAAEFYLDGDLLEKKNDDTLNAALNKLFSGDMLASYVYNSVGHSLYTDNDIKARIDNVALYDYALTSEQVDELPENAAYLYTFEPETIIRSYQSVSETLVSLKGTTLTSIPELQSVSPDGTLTTKIWTDSNSGYYYSVHKTSDGVMGTVIEPSKLGLITSTENLSEGFTADTASVTKVSFDENYTMPFGKHSQLRNNYNELSFPLVKGDSVLTVIVRMYDDGMAFRYALNHSAEVRSEVSEVIFPENGTLWGSMPNATYEYEIGQFSVKDMTAQQFDCSIPLTGHILDKYWVLLSEANVFNEPEPYCADFLKTEKGSRALTWRFGNKVNTVRMNGSFATPWRVAIIADNLNGMTCSDMILDLNPPSVIEDTSWIKPGKVAWSWWSSGGDSPIEYHMQKDYVDFAAENGWDNSSEKVKELCEYGASKGIGIYLWYGVNNICHYDYTDSFGNHAYPYYSLLDETTIRREFERIKDLGVKGVKVDYYESDTQESMKQMYLCMDIAAKNKLMVLFHGCTMPHGESRTYPNVVSYEAVYGTEYYKWRDTPSLTNRINYPFNRNVVGSADFTPTGTPIDGIKATAGFALSDVVTIESGVQHFAQSVYTYEGSTALPLLNDVPAAWDDMKVLDGYPMQFSVIGRKSGDDWYIGAATIQPRTINIKLSDIITDDGVYNAYIFGDNSDGSTIEVKTLSDLTKDSVITQNLLSNGGCVIKLTRNGIKLTTPYSNYKFYEAESARLSGLAAVTPDKYCSGNTYVGYVGGGRDNYITFTNVIAEKSGEYPLRVYYISGEPRNLKIDVNSKYVTTLDGLYANKNDWVGIAAVNTTVYLNEGANTISLYNDSGYAPSIDRIAIVNVPDEVIGDVNADGQFSVADIVMMQKFLLGNGELTDWKAGDLCADERIDVFDMVIMRKLILNK